MSASSNQVAANPMAATLFLVQAKQAYAKGLWVEVGRLSQLCLQSAGNDMALRNAALGLLSAALMQVGQFAQALPICLALDNTLPHDVNNLANIGHLLTTLQRTKEALVYLQRAVQVAPDNAGAHLNLAFAYAALHDIEQAKLNFSKASQLNPALAKAYYGLAEILLLKEGRIQEALDAYELGLKLEPKNFTALSNLMFIQHFLYPHDMKHQTAVLQRYSHATASIAKTPHAPMQLHAPLRVGIVSADFCNHVVARFLDSTLTAISAEPTLSSRVILVGYYNRNLNDEVTKRLKGGFQLWRQIDQASDEQVAQQIKLDQIDILIDLSGHTVGNRLPLFARKPAPVQLSWLGWFGSTGLKAIDYVLADPVCVPIEEERWLVERVWRMPQLRYCFTPPEDAPLVSPAPCLTNGHITFGCYQSLTKINDGVLHCWSKILAASPQARLRIQSIALGQPEQQTRFKQRLQQAGIAPEQVELVAGMSTPDYLASYGEVDILLDTFPYTGGTTTAEALWMGLPTLTLALPGMLGRQGEAFMQAAGLPEWIIYSEDDYVAKAIAWACADTSAIEALAALRYGLRERVHASAVYDAQTFAAQWIDALYDMWQEKVTTSQPMIKAGKKSKK